MSKKHPVIAVTGLIGLVLLPGRIHLPQIVIAQLGAIGPAPRVLGLVDKHNLLERPSLRNCAIGIAEWQSDERALIKPWPFFVFPFPKYQ